MSASEPEDYKRCPDCAERVLSAARKCRYCGYRFDGADRDRGSALADLIPGLARPSRFATMSELLADWDVELGPDERVAVFSLVIMDERPGFLLVTSDRLIFFTQVSRREYATRVQCPLANVSQVRLAGSRLRPRLKLRGREQEHVVRGMRASDIRWLESYLIEHGVDLADRAPSDTGRREP
jgi:Uncharacterised protein family UPF0547